MKFASGLSGKNVIFVIAMIPLILASPERERREFGGGDGRITPVADAAGSPTNGHALLIGCSQYPHCKSVPELWGPVNDVALFRRFLSDEFAFAEKNITTLAGWSPDESSRPTYTNIIDGFKNLVNQARPNSQIVILLSGHGTQVPTKQKALAFEQTELDGLDEAFLPADFPGFSQGKPAPLIRDDQIANWLDQLQQKGAHVWIIFDCCHSGTLDRDPKVVEKQRGVHPLDLGLPKAALENAFKKASANRGQTSEETTVINLISPTKSNGSITAFYASQSFEKTYDLPRPEEAAPTADNYYGLLTYTLLQTLKQRKTPLNYGTLGRLLVSQYRAERGSRAPTPFFAGDLDRKVLGFSSWPQTRLFLERQAGKVRVSGGELMGIRPGTILAVHPPTGSKNKDQLLGYVRVTESSATHSFVTQCAFADKKAVALERFPELARCEIAQQNLGDLRLKLALVSPNDEERQKLLKEINSLPQNKRNLLQIQDNMDQAEWILQIVTPEQAEEKFDLKVDQPQLFLWQKGEIRRGLSSTEKAKSSSRILFTHYSLDDSEKMREALESDLQRIFVWQNIWRVAGQMKSASDSQEESSLEMQVTLLKGADDASGGVPLPSRLKPGQIIEVRLRNQGLDDLWVTLLFLDAHFGIDVWYSGSLKGLQKLIPLKARINTESAGPEGLVALAFPMSHYKIQPDLSFLKQKPLGNHKGDRLPPPAPQTPFERILQTAAYGQGTRSWIPNIPTYPQIRSWSWITSPGPSQPTKNP